MNRPVPSPDIRSRVLAAVELERAPTRGAAERQQVAALVCGFAVLGGVWVRLGVHPGTRPVAYIATLVGAWLLLTVVATWGGVARGRSMLGRPQALKAAVAGLTPLAMLAVWWPIAQGWPSTLENESGAFEVAQCVVGTGLLGIGPLLAFLFTHRGSEPIRPWLSGAALGVAAAGWGALALVIICRHASRSHIILGHISPIFLMAALGAALGSRVLAIRSDRG
jgi:hypothetical protein